ncbi:stage II sporulation protein M [Aliikangiella sp. G2MR2-5]|uniref:stage II sporulation protein M n=1 Tax=Aliikangiella sp. G2MR2-5 TaxID=2788943 RepID=UPI0018A8F51C|nr:stage II sporulation protein M [Aliikangiella sp. G2MR2-5]
MRQEEFELRYNPQWNEFEKQIQLAKGSWRKRKQHSLTLNGFADNYRLLCYCLSLARERQYSPQLIQRLQALVFSGHQTFYQKRSGLFHRIYQFILVGFPRAVREQSKFVWTATLIFYLPALTVFFITLLFPELVYSVIDPDSVARIESMYDPSLNHIGRERQSDTDFMMFGFYIKNNIGIAFQSFAGGILATLGTLFFLIYNGVFFGAIDAHIINIGYQQTFYAFVAGHSSYELTGIVLSGAAGLQLGWAVIAPGNFTRKQALVNAGRSAMSLVYGAIVLLIVAAFVEAFWSSSSSITPSVKYWVGLAGWLFIILYLTLAGRRV